VLNIADLRTLHSREALVQLRERFGAKVFDTAIRQSIRYAESAERAVSILDYAPQLGSDYLALGQEVLERVGFTEEAQRVAAMRENAPVPVEEVPSP
jgi:chromosome partitioning protein